MNPESFDRRDAEALDSFWDELVLDQLTGTTPRAAASPNETLVMNMQTLLTSADDGAENLLRRLVFGATPEPDLAMGHSRPMPGAPPKQMRTTWSIRKYGQLAAVALAVMLVGALVAAQIAGWLGGGGNTNHLTAIPAAISQVDATPAALASPTVNDSAIVWTLTFDGTNVEIGATALADGTLYRLIRSDQFTGVQAVDTTTGTEKWRSAQEWRGNGLGVDSNGIYFPTVRGVRAISLERGEQMWDITTIIDPRSLTTKGGVSMSGMA